MLYLGFMTARPKHKLHGPCKTHRTLQEKGTGAEQNSGIKCHLKWLLCRVEQCQTHFLHYRQLRLLCDGQSRNAGKFFTISPRKVTADLLRLLLFINMSALLSHCIRLKKIVWAFLSGGLCVSGEGGCVLAFGYIRCYRRNPYCWVWNSCRRGKIRSSSVVYWALKNHL